MTRIAVENSAVSAIKAAHWFGRHWPVNYWTSDLFRAAGDDFRKMRRDGFNAVVVVVPWLGFVSPDTGEIRGEMFAKLDDLISLASSSGLSTILRVGYSWNNGEPDNKGYIHKLYTDSTVYNSWLRYMEELGGRYADDDRLVLTFLSWEDLWVVLDLASAPIEHRLAFARTSAYQDFLRDNLSLPELSLRYENEFKAFHEVPLPQRRHPSFYMFLDFFKYSFVHRFILPAQSRAPKLTAEVRVDFDAVFNGSDLHTLYDWSDTWDVPNSEWIAVYFKPYYGSSNTTSAISAEDAHDNLRRLMSQVRGRVGNKKIFIDQFNFRDDTPGLSSDFIPDDQLPRFLELSTQTLTEMVDGYALWFYHGYEHNAISNPDFSMNLEGWKTRGPVSVKAGQLILAEGSFLEKDVYYTDLHAHLEHPSITLRLRGSCASGATLTVTESRRGHRTSDITLADGVPFSLSVHRDRVMRVRLEAVGGVVTLSEVSLFAFAQAGTVYDSSGDPLWMLPHVVSFNERLWPEGHAHEVAPYADGWIGGYCAGELPAEAGSELVFEFYLPPDWPNCPNLLVSANGAEMRLNLQHGLQIVRLAPPALNERVRYTLWTRDTTSAYRLGLGSDTRQLACILRSVSMQ